LGDGEVTARFLLCALLAAGAANSADRPPLELEVKIPLGEVRGRIDHLAIDVRRQRLYVAELDNDSVEVVDLKERKALRRLSGFKEPQGIGYVPSTDTLYVANAGDGSVRIFRGADLTPAGRIELGSDADNVRVDDRTHRVFIGHGSGAIAVIDTASRQKVADIPLKEHPESFQLDPLSPRIFVNVPDAREVALVDRNANKQIAAWSTGALRANYPMALDPVHGHVLAVFRHPAKVGVFDGETGRLLSAVDTCGDADDVFFDAKRNRLYISCGEGFIDVLESLGEGYTRLGRLPTAGGARTSFFAPDLDRLMLAVRAAGGGQASIWVFLPTS
jgi:DNA-binding beta-propeller fold protein YncE